MKNILKFLIVIFFYLMTFTIVNAGPVTKKTALIVAQNFFRTELNKSIDNTVLNYLAINSKIDVNKVLLHVYYNANSFIIISGEDQVYPIIGYSNESTYSVNGDNTSFNWWIKKVTTAIEEVSTAKSINVPTKVSNAWERYTSQNKLKSSSSSNAKSVSPLVTTTWNQSPVYNDSCPKFNGTPCVTGCVATALAQVMNFYKYPYMGQGSNTYFHPYFGNITANFDTVIDWKYIVGQTIGNCLHPAALERLMFKCGVAVDMDYTPTESGTQVSYALNALYYNFKYRRYLMDITRDTCAEDRWLTYLNDNLTMGYPMLYAGDDSVEGGHCWVCDGVDNNNNFHFNWGWGGADNGYFSVDNINSGNGNFNADQEIIINIVADTSTYPYCIPNKTYTITSWTFDNGTGTSNYSNNTNCQWLIQPDSGDYIQINFSRINTEANHDFVTVYDGATTSAPILGIYSGDIMPPIAPIITSSPNALVVFTSDSANTDMGWELSYTSLYKCKPHAVISNIIDTIFDNGSGLFNYGNNMNCQWLLEADSINQHLQLEFHYFSTEYRKDSLTIYDGDSTNAPILGHFSGDTIPHDIFSSSNKLLLVFVTDSVNTYNGWQIEALSIDSLSGIGIVDNNVFKAIKLYPNPTHNKLNVYGDFINDGLTKFSIYNIQSVQQYSEEDYLKAGYNLRSFDVSSLRAGMYIMKIENTKGSYYLKFIIQ